MKVKDLLTDESKWTQGSYAKDINNRAVNFYDGDAKWCLLGAIVRCYTGTADYYIVYNKVLDKVGFPVSWNDNEDRTFEEVKQLIEELNI